MIAQRQRGWIPKAHSFSLCLEDGIQPNADMVAPSFGDLPPFVSILPAGDAGRGAFGFEGGKPKSGL